MLFDVHTHLQDERFSERREDVFLRACAAGITRMGCCATCEEDWAGVVALGLRPDVVPCLGVHPWWATTVAPDWALRLELHLAGCQTLSVGEAGLDGTLDEAARAVQKEVFVTQVALAATFQRPLVVHGAKAWSWLREVLEACPLLPPTILLHSFGGRAEDVPAFAELGCYFSFGGAVTRKGHRRTKEALQVVPRDRLVVETDAPDQCPDFEGAPVDRINEPAFLVPVVQAVAAILECAEEVLRPQLFANACRLFSPVLEKAL